MANTPQFTGVAERALGIIEKVAKAGLSGIDAPLLILRWTSCRVMICGLKA